MVVNKGCYGYYAIQTQTTIIEVIMNDVEIKSMSTHTSTCIGQSRKLHKKVKVEHLQSLIKDFKSGGWMDGWVGRLMGRLKAVLRIACSNKNDEIKKQLFLIVAIVASNDTIYHSEYIV